MLTKFGAYLTALGISRDDVKLVWMQWLSVAALILSGTLNLTTWSDYLGLHVTPQIMHWIMVLCSVSLWFGAKFSTSPLPSAGVTAHLVQLEKEKP